MATVEDGDTVGFIYLKTFVVRGDLPQHLKKKFLGNSRLTRDLKKVMPFAKEMGNRIKIYDHALDSLEGKRDEKQYLKAEAKKLRQDFEDDMKRLNVRQGKLLIKLVHRETGHTGYELLSDYKSSGSAVFWNTFASIFGASLKKEYDRKEEMEIEYLIDFYRLDKV